MSPAPLPASTNPAAAPWSAPGGGNLGLWYDKHYAAWPSMARLLDPKRERSDEEKRARLLFVEQAVTAGLGSRAEMLGEYAVRQRLHVGAVAGEWFEARTVSKFVTGLGRAHPVENGFDWHHALGVPVLRGSGQKGIVRDWAERWLDEADVEAGHILGTAGSSGAVAFLPALPISPPTLCIDGTTPHLTEYYQDGEPPADWYDPKPLQWLAVAAGCTFQFAVVPLRRGDEGKRLCAKACGWLRQALETLGAGAGTAGDRGLFTVLEAPRDAG